MKHQREKRPREDIIGSIPDIYRYFDVILRMNPWCMLKLMTDKQNTYLHDVKGYDKNII